MFYEHRASWYVLSTKWCFYQIAVLFCYKIYRQIFGIATILGLLGGPNRVQSTRIQVFFELAEQTLVRVLECYLIIRIT